MNRRHLIQLLTGGAFVPPMLLARIGDVSASTQLASDPVSHTPDVATPEAIEDEDIVDVDIRDVLARPWKFEDQLLRFGGTVAEMRVAPPEKGFLTGDEEDRTVPFRTQMLIDVEFEEYNSETVLVACDFDPEDVHRDVYVEIVATHGGTHFEQARGGGYWEWPLFIAGSIEPVPEPERS